MTAPPSFVYGSKLTTHPDQPTATILYVTFSLVIWMVIGVVVYFPDGHRHGELTKSTLGAGVGI